jgi:hypothetical protein
MQNCSKLAMLENVLKGPLCMHALGCKPPACMVAGQKALVLPLAMTRLQWERVPGLPQRAYHLRVQDLRFQAGHQPARVLHPGKLTGVAHVAMLG